MSTRGRPRRLRSGNLPNAARPSSQHPGRCSPEYVQAWGQVQASDGLYGYFANAYPTANTVLTQATEELIGGKTTVQAALATVQSAWAQAHG